MTTFVLAACSGSADQTESNEMFFSKKKQAEVSTSVGPVVGEALLKQPVFSAASPTTVEPAATVTAYAVIGVPPQASFRDSPIYGQDQIAFVTQGSADNPPLAVVNTPQRVEIWELSRDATPRFVRRRSARFDSKQDDWINLSVIEVACLPHDWLLLHMGHSEGFTLLVYDVAANSCSTLGKVEPLGLVPEKLFQSAEVFIGSRLKMFDVLPLDPQQALVLFYTGRTRVSAELYYTTPAHIYAFTQRHPGGVEVLQLGADDGAVDRWMVDNKTLWLSTQDYRNPKHRKSFAFTLDLHKVLSE